MTAPPLSPRVPLVLPAVAALVAYIQAFGNGFVRDDMAIIVGNPFARTLAGLRHMLTSDLFVASLDPQRSNYYRPLGALLNWISVQLFGDSQLGHHGINIALHALVAALVAAVLLRYRVRRGVALSAAVLFAVHPATADTVAYVGGRYELLGWLVLLATALRLSNATSSRALVGLGTFGLVGAAFSREAFLVAVFALPLLAAFRNADQQPDRHAARYVGLGAFGGLAVVALVRRVFDVRWSASPAAGVRDWIETAAAFALRMLQVIVAPVDLTLELTLDRVGTAASIALLVVLVATVGLTAWMVATRLREHLGLVLFGGALFLSGVVIHTPVALSLGYTSDRYAYFFVVAVALFLAPLASHLADRIALQIDSRLVQLIVTVPYLVAAALLPLTWSRVVEWRSETSLQDAMYRARPQDPVARLAKGVQLLSQGEYAEALPHCMANEGKTTLLAAQTDQCVAMSLLGLKRKNEAVPYLERLAPLPQYRIDRAFRMALIDALFAVGDLDRITSTLDRWGPELSAEPDIIRARAEVARRQTKATIPK